MANNDQITVDLIAKTDQYNAALNSSASATEAFGSRVNRAMDGAVGGVNRMGNAFAQAATQFAAGFLGAITVDKIVDLGRASIDTADKLNKMSQQVGLSVESLSALQSQAALSDVGFDQFGQAMARLARSVAQATDETSQQAQAFKAMGISVTDASGKLRPMQDILQDFAAKMATYKDGTAKTALAQIELGRSGAQLIPLLNELGTAGFDAVRKHAEEYNQVIGPEQAAQAEQFNDNLTRMHMAVTGFANAVTAQVLPVLVKYTDDLSDAAKTNDRYAESANSVASAVKVIIFALQGLWTASKITTDLTYGIVKASAEAGNALVTDGIGAAAGKFKSLGLDIGGSIANLNKGFDSLFGTFANVSGGADSTAKAISGTGKAAQDADAPTLHLGKSAADTADKLASAEASANRFLDSLDSIGADKYTKALQQYNAQLVTAQQIYDKLVKSGDPLGKAQQFLADATEKAKDAFNALVQAMRNANDVDSVLGNAVSRAEQQISDLTRTLGMSEQAKREDAEATKLVNQALAEMGDFVGPLTEDQQRLIDRLKEAGIQTARLTEAERLNQQATQEWTNIWVQAGNSIADTFASILVNGGSLMDSLVSLAKQTVQQIIAYFAKLAVINPILNAVFGGSSGWSTLATLGSAAAGAGGAGGGSTGFSGASNLMSIGSTIGKGFSSYVEGLYASNGMGSSFLGTVNYGDFGNTFTPSMFTYGAAAVGGAYAGYNRYQQAGGGVGGVAGGLAYGVGTAYAGIGTAAALSGGLSAGLAAIPVVGWIALAAMAVDMLSGGKLFGTEGKFNFGKQQAFVGPGGATVVAGWDQKGQSALFGGSTHEWHNLDVDQKTQDAWNQFVTQLITGNEGLAKQLGTKAAEIASGEFDVIFDKKGNVKSTSSIVNGVTYNEDQQHFQMRVIAETMLGTLDTVSQGISAAVEQYRGDAEVLYNVTNQLANAAVFLHNGGQFLALGADQSLTALLSLAEGAQQFGESIDQTLARITQAQQQYDQFVGQFRTTTYVDDFEATLSGINQQMLANIKTANQLAQAAGAEGASEQDLANIHAYAAKQMAQAIQALEASAQSLAFSLGLTTMGSLDDVNAEIARLQAKADQGAGSVRDFGQAMQQAAQRATDAMNLLLGDLSPLNDAEKLQRALQGLRAGTVTADQVLQIGRRLYASSQQYVDLFNMVQAMSRGGVSPAVSVGGSRGGGGLTGAESQRLSDLLAQQQQLQAAAQLQQYQTLAQQIAEIASAKGEDWQQVVKDMGIDLKAFEKGLGMTEDQLGDYITSIQQQTDSAGENTQSIVDAINAMSDAVVVALGGTPQHSKPGEQMTGGGNNGNGHSGHARDIGRAIGDAIVANLPRNLRQRTPVGS